MPIHMGTSYLDIRIRLDLNHVGIVNLHLLAILVYDRHTGLVICLVVSMVSNVWCEPWSAVII